MVEEKKVELVVTDEVVAEKALGRKEGKEEGLAKKTMDKEDKDREDMTSMVLDLV